MRDDRQRLEDIIETCSNLERNILAHGYFDIDVAIVWQAISRDIPQLRQQVEVILSQL